MTRNGCMSGSITVEASFAVPIFVVAVVAFLYLFETLILQGDLQDQMVEAARHYACYGMEAPFFQTEDGDMHLIVWETEAGEEYCHSDIRQDIPGLPSWFLQVHLYQRIQVNAYAGKSMMPETTTEDAVYVYVAENGKVYHRDIGCTYLRLGIQTVAGDAVGDMRNQSGGKYKACESCTEGEAATEYGNVYITPYGARYHKDKECPGLRRTVRKVALSAVGELPPCSKCGRDQ